MRVSALLPFWVCLSLPLGAPGCLFPDFRAEDAAGGGSAQGGSGAAEGGGSGGAQGGDACGDPSCAVESCDNQSDDDNDGKLDCFDSDCNESPACAGRCADTTSLPCGSVHNAQRTDTTGSTRRIGPPAYGCNATPLPGPELAYRLAGQPGQNVFVEAFGLEHDAAIFLIDVESGAACDARSSCKTAGSSSSDAAAEAIGFLAEAGRDYYLVVDAAEPTGFSLSVQCAPSDGCFPARAIEEGQTATGSNALGSAANVTQNVNSYSCGGGVQDGPEASFMFTAVSAGTFAATLTNLSGNLSLFVIGPPSCGSTCLSSSSFSTRPGSQDESVSFTASANTTYYIVADGRTTSSFELGITRLPP